MLTKQQAIAKALAKAKRTGQWHFVWFDGEECGWQVGNEFDADTWFLGQAADFACSPDGEVESVLA